MAHLSAPVMGLITFSLSLLLPPVDGLANALARDRDPVVLTGADLGELIGSPAAGIVGFRWDPLNYWVQIPVQVDERAVVDFGAIYGTTPYGYTLLAYTDTSTFTGPDPNPLLDADDELVFRARDAGDERPPVPVSPGERPATVLNYWPPGVIPGVGVEVVVTDPLTSAVGFVYLFRGDGSIDPGAGVTPIDYSFNLLSGSYKATYNVNSGPNPEDSRLTTSAYSVHFSDRWKRNETRIVAGGASGADILDRHKNLFAPGNCSRSEDTFSAGEGAFIINRAGPVRALRGYVGANSGPTTYRVHTFYAEREDILTVLRVHPIPGVMDYFDYSPAAAGMTYRNILNPAGVPVDGTPDLVAAGLPEWEMVSGAQGTLVATLLLDSDIPGLAPSHYYSDDTTPPAGQCTGDAFEYGASGLWINQGIPNTDPALAAQYGGQLYRFQATRLLAYDAPGRDALFAIQVDDQARHPLATAVQPWYPSGDVAIGRGGARALALAPNPTGGPVRARLTLDRGARVLVRAFDAAGRVVATLAAGRWDAGPHEIVWDARGLTPGIYLVRAEVNGRIEAVARLVRLR